MINHHIILLWELVHKEEWVPKNWCFQIVVLEKTLESSLGCKEIKPVHSEGNQPWIFIGMSGAEASILWSSGVKSQHIGKYPDVGKDWGQMRREWQRLRRLDGITDSMEMSLSKLTVIVNDKEAWHAAVHRITNSQTWLSDWTTGPC